MHLYLLIRYRYRRCCWNELRRFDVPAAACPNAMHLYQHEDPAIASYVMLSKFITTALSSIKWCRTLHALTVMYAVAWNNLINQTGFRCIVIVRVLPRHRLVKLRLEASQTVELANYDHSITFACWTLLGERSLRVARCVYQQHRIALGLGSFEIAILVYKFGDTTLYEGTMECI